MAKKYDYIKVRVNSTEREMLEKLVSDEHLSSLSDAVRKLAFDHTAKDRTILLGHLKEISLAQQAFAALVYSGITAGTLDEASMVAMERQITRLQKSSAKLCRQYRQVI